MVLNNKPQMFAISFPSNFFYPEVKKRWEPLVERMRLPYQSIDDFMNAQIQSIQFPNLNMPTSVQQRWQYEVTYPGGKELEPLIGKSLNITFKLTESYLSYWIMWDQIDTYLHYVHHHTDKKNCWMEPIFLSFLSDAGFELVKFIFREITPTSLSDLNLSYAAQIASYNTFTLGLNYNLFSVK